MKGCVILRQKESEERKKRWTLSTPCLSKSWKIFVCFYYVFIDLLSKTINKEENIIFFFFLFSFYFITNITKYKTFMVFIFSFFPLFLCLFKFSLLFFFFFFWNKIKCNFHFLLVFTSITSIHQYTRLTRLI